jgi:carbonic anhydrase/acetyltransferase-like protein (isoleucine patch superfamily)
MKRKYELVKCDRPDRFRVRALVSFSMVEEGTIGGYVESEFNLSQEGNCWIANDAEVFENAHISEDAFVGDNAKVFGSARVSGKAMILRDARVRGKATVSNHTVVSGNVEELGEVSSQEEIKNDQ